MVIAGRIEEISILRELTHKKQSEFVAVYGRRRVGKTYLIRQVYREHIVFECSGLHQKSFSQQLENFWLTLQEWSPNGSVVAPPKTWLQAFAQLKTFLNTLKGKKKKVVFLDEIPWFETRRSGFLAALDNFWNQYCSRRSDIILVICGSAASWIIKKVINDRGGLHNRITQHIRLMPFTLYETQEYLTLHQVQLAPKDIVQLYMSVGGIPFYLKDVKPGKSVPQILDDLFFVNQAPLSKEFSNLYASLFYNSELHEKIIEVLASNNQGVTRNEIARQTGISSGGGLSLAIRELIECGFVQQMLSPYRAGSKESLIFRLIDEFSYFYFKFLSKKRQKTSWMQLSQTPQYRTWAGFAFENLCIKHARQIKQALGIDGIVGQEFAWRYRGKETEDGAQIDLGIDRSDNCINLIECKFHNDVFRISKAYAERLEKKVQVFRKRTKTKKNIFFTFLSVYGVEKNTYYLGLISNQVHVEDLFVPRRITR